MNKKQKSIRGLAEELKEIRERPISSNQIDQFNEIMEKDVEKKDDHEEPGKKIARPAETTL